MKAVIKITATMAAIIWLSWEVQKYNQLLGFYLGVALMLVALVLITGQEIKETDTTRERK